MRVGYRLSRFGGVGLVMGDTKIRGAAMGGKGGTGVRLSFAAGAVRAAFGSYLSPAISRTPRVPKSTLSITDNRTGKQYEIPVQDGTVRAVDLRQIKAAEDDPGLMTYDPGFLNTAACRSAVSYIDGDRGILRYRGYPIEQLAEQSTFLETAYLLLHGELPSAAELDSWVYNITHHTIIHENIKKFIDGFHHDAHPMGMFVSTVAALSTFRSEEHTSELQSLAYLVCRLLLEKK